MGNFIKEFWQLPYLYFFPINYGDRNLLKMIVGTVGSLIGRMTIDGISLPNWDTLEMKVAFTKQDTGIAGVNWSVPSKQAGIWSSFSWGKRKTSSSEW